METFFFRNPRFFGLVVALLIVLGAASWLSIGRQEDPTITNLRATITTFFPGANPARVEALGEWCAAFLAGVGAASESSLNETESEVLGLRVVRLRPTP